jgi:hypothetical protein
MCGGLRVKDKDIDMRRLSIIALGLMLFSHQTMNVQMVRAAQLSLGSSSDIEAELQSSPTATNAEVAGLSPNPEECEETKPTKGSELQGEVQGEVQSPTQAGTGLNYQAADGAPGPDGQLVAQQPAEGDDCCEVSGNSLCEVAGLPPVGGAGLLASPLLLLAGLPLAAIPFIAGDDGDSESGPPVPEPPATAGLVVGLGAVGLLLSRRQRKNKSDR